MPLMTNASDAASALLLVMMVLILEMTSNKRVMNRTRQGNVCLVPL